MSARGQPGSSWSSSTWSSSSSTPPAQHTEDAVSARPKHTEDALRAADAPPVFRVVHRPGRAGGGGGYRLWLGTFAVAEDVARAHVVAMLALLGGPVVVTAGLAAGHALVPAPAAVEA